jgi:hypothetical protein
MKPADVPPSPDPTLRSTLPSAIDDVVVAGSTPSASSVVTVVADGWVVVVDASGAALGARVMTGEAPGRGVGSAGPGVDAGAAGVVVAGAGGGG